MRRGDLSPRRARKTPGRWESGRPAALSAGRPPRPTAMGSGRASQQPGRGPPGPVTAGSVAPAQVDSPGHAEPVSSSRSSLSFSLPTPETRTMTSPGANVSPLPLPPSHHAAPALPPPRLSFPGSALVHIVRRLGSGPGAREAQERGGAGRDTPGR